MSEPETNSGQEPSPPPLVAATGPAVPAWRSIPTLVLAVVVVLLLAVSVTFFSLWLSSSTRLRTSESRGTTLSSQLTACAKKSDLERQALQADNQVFGDLLDALQDDDNGDIAASTTNIQHAGDGIKTSEQYVKDSNSAGCDR